MRKSRGKRKDNGEWVYGYYCEVQGRHIIIPAFKNSNSEVRPFVGATNGIQGYHEVIPETVGQSTSLKDKNSKETYHKDIVRRDELCVKFTGILEWVENADYDYVYAVNWGSSTLEISHITGWMIKLQDGSYETFDPDTDEIIGNIHDKPSLLETKNET